MNPEAVKWLETLTLEEHMRRFAGALGGDSLYSLKADHQYKDPSGACYTCAPARRAGTLEVIG